MRAIAPELWEEGLKLPTLLDRARRGVPEAREAAEKARRDGARSALAQALVWRLPRDLADDVRARRAML